MFEIRSEDFKIELFSENRHSPPPYSLSLSLSVRYLFVLWVESGDIQDDHIPAINRFLQYSFLYSIINPVVEYYFISLNGKLSLLKTLIVLFQNHWPLLGLYVSRMVLHFIEDFSFLLKIWALFQFNISFLDSEEACKPLNQILRREKNEILSH